MKNAMKKLMSLVMVAMILVSALPFAAAAADCTKGFDCQHDGVMHIAGCPKIPCNPAACDHGGYNHLPECPKACNGQKDCAQFAAGNTAPEYHQAGCLAISKAEESIDNGTACTNSYECKHVGNMHVAGCPMIPCSADATCDHGGWNHLESCPYACRNSSACHADYHVDGCPAKQTNNTTNNNTSNNDTTSGSSAYNKNSGDVVLEICMDKNQTPTKTVSIKSGIALDGVVTLDEVKTVVKKYFGSVDTATGIIYDGLYVKQTYAGNIIEWVNDDKVASVGGLYDAANNSKLVTIRVYISNAKAVSTKADSSNPKTGDGIFMAVATMTASASALATGFFFNKKRAK